MVDALLDVKRSAAAETSPAWPQKAPPIQQASCNAADEWAEAGHARPQSVLASHGFSDHQEESFPLRQALGSVLRYSREEVMATERRVLLAALTQGGGTPIKSVLCERASTSDGSPGYLHGRTPRTATSSGRRGQALRPLESLAPKIVHRHHHHHYHHHYPPALNPDALSAVENTVQSKDQRTATTDMEGNSSSSASRGAATRRGDGTADAMDPAGQHVHMHYHHHACEEVVQPRTKRLLDDATLDNITTTAGHGSGGRSRCGAGPAAGSSAWPDTQVPSLA